MDLIGHLTGIIGQMVRPETIIEPLERVEASYDRWADIDGRASGASAQSTRRSMSSTSPSFNGKPAKL